MLPYLLAIGRRLGARTPARERADIPNSVVLDPAALVR
jgi:hypothetical protein